MFSLLSSAFQCSSGLYQVRAVDHLAADGQHACVGMCRERGDDLFGMANVLRRRCESGVDDRHLVGMDGKLAGETFATRGFGFAAKAVVVLEVGENLIDRLDSGGDGAR